MNENELKFRQWPTSNFLSNSDHIRRAHQLCISCGQNDMRLLRQDFDYKYPIEYRQLLV